MWGLWKRCLWQFIEMFLSSFLTEIREGSWCYKGRNVHHLNVVTYNWTEGSIISHVRIYEQWAACLSGQGASYSALLPGMINVRCCDVQWDMRHGGWSVESVWGHRPCGAQGDDQCPLIYDIIHSIPSTVTWLMSLTHNCPLNLSWRHRITEHRTSWRINK